MAYRFEKNQINGQTELVIDGWEKGIADSPYQGIASLKNWNIKYYPNVAYVNYKQQAVSLPASTTVSFDAATNIGNQAITQSNTKIARDTFAYVPAGSNSYTCSGTNRLLIVSIETYLGGSVTAAPTYNGVSMTLVSRLLVSSGSSVYANVYYLLNPASGTNTLVISTSGSAIAYAASYKNVSQTAGLVTYNTATNTAPGSLSVSLTCTGSNWGIGVWYYSTSSSASVNASCYVNDGAGMSIWDTNASQTGNFSMAVSTTNSGTTANGAVVLVFQDVGNTAYPISISGSHTATGTNLSMFVQVEVVPSTTISSITYNSVALTKLQDVLDSNGYGQSIWYLLNPTTGTHTVQVTGTCSSSGTIIANAITHTGVNSITAVPAVTNTSIPASSQSLSISTVITNAWSLMFVSCAPNTTATMGAGTTSRINTTSSTYQAIIVDSNAPLFTPGSTSLTVNFSGSITDTTALIITLNPTTAVQFTAWTQSPTGLIYLLDANGNVFKQDTVAGSTFSKITGNSLVGAKGNGISFWNNYLIVFRDTYIDYCGDGTGDAGVTSSNWNTSTNPLWPIALRSSVSLTATPGANATSATLSAAWTGPTGTYQGTFSLTGGPPNTQTVSLSLANGSTAVTWTPALALASSAASVSNVSVVQAGTHLAFISSNDSNLYFQNGNNVGALAVPSGQTFNPLVKASYTVNYSALGLPTYEQVSWISELRTNLLVGGIRKIYPWDRVSTSWTTPIPVTEPIQRIINIMNNIYILAGDKGNIYSSNGYTVAPAKKIPDAFFNAIDPKITFGGIMAHRLKLWFQAYAVDINGNPLGSGIFSYDPDTQALNFESQNSVGFTPSGTSGPGEVLVDISDVSQTNYDSYISSWYNQGIGGLDYNNATLYQNNEPEIITDLIPIGTTVQPRTFQSVEFKLDQPLATGDSITVYARKNLSDTWTQLGSTSTQVLSDFYDHFPIDQFQWVQFKITASCASSGSSFIRLREIRVR